MYFSQICKINDDATRYHLLLILMGKPSLQILKFQKVNSENFPHNHVITITNIINRRNTLLRKFCVD